MLHNKSTIKSKWCEVKEYNDWLASWHALMVRAQGIFVTFQ